MPITDPSASIQNYEMAALAASNVPRMTSGYSTLAQQQQAMRSMTGGVYGGTNEYCGMENAYRAGLRSGGGLKAYSSSGSPPPGAFYGDMMTQQQQMNLRQMVNNENAFHPQSNNWAQQPQPQSCARMMPSFNENSLFSDFMPASQRANSFGSTNNFSSTTTSSYLSSLSSAHSRDEGLGDSPTST